jgi:hypothetical protein
MAISSLRVRSPVQHRDGLHDPGRADLPARADQGLDHHRAFDSGLPGRIGILWRDSHDRLWQLIAADELAERREMVLPLGVAIGGFRGDIEESDRGAACRGSRPPRAKRCRGRSLRAPTMSASRSPPKWT